MPGGGEPAGQGQPLRDLGRLEAVVHEPHRLVVEELVEVALGGQEIPHALGAPHRPVVLGEGHVRVAAEAVARLVEVLRPRIRVPDLRPADRVEIVQVVGGVLGQVQGPPCRVEHVHLGRRLRLRGELEHDLDAVEAVRLERGRDGQGGRDERHGAARGRLAEARVHLPARAAGQGGAELELAAANHRGPGQDRLRHHLLHEARGRHHRHLAGGDARFVQHAAHAAVVIGVAVAVDHRGHRPVPAVRAIEREGGAGHFRRDERIDDDHAAVALDEGHVRDVEAAHLVDAVRDLEEAVVHVQPRLAPEARVHGGRRLRRGEERVVAQAPHHPALGVPDHHLGQAGHEAAGGILEVLRVGEGQRLPRGLLTGPGGRGRVPGGVVAHAG